MPTIPKLIISLGIIWGATEIGKKVPSLAGLIGTMPLTGALILIWLYLDNKDNPAIIKSYTLGAIWGIIPSILFFLVVFIAFKKNMAFLTAFLSGSAAWLIGAFLHQILLRS